MGSPASSADPFQTEVATIALRAAKAHGFALAGGQALIAHGIVQRPTEDVDLFTDDDDGVRAATGPVIAALTDAHLEAAVLPDGFEDELVEFEVTRDDRTVRLTLARFDRTKPPITMATGPVLDLEDVVGSKVAAMVTRGQPRDYVDVAAVLRRFSADQLMAFARRADPQISSEEVEESMQRLDRLDDAVFVQLYQADPPRSGAPSRVGRDPGGYEPGVFAGFDSSLAGLRRQRHGIRSSCGASGATTCGAHPLRPAISCPRKRRARRQTGC